MNAYRTALFATLLSLPFPTDTPVERLGVKGPLQFHETTFNLAWSSKPTDTYYVQEYLPAGETVEHFNQMLTIDILDKDVTVEDAVRQKTDELDARKKSDPSCGYSVAKSPDGSEAMVDFVLGESKRDTMTVVEFNIYRYKRVATANNRTGLLLYGYSRRAYGDDITSFLQKLSTTRTEMLNTMIGSEMPTIALSTK